MYCLLCHEKIPRLRAWRTKSEFCSDEHAAQYKKQTLDRLLTDQNPANNEKPGPVAGSEGEQDPFFHDEMGARPSMEAETVANDDSEPDSPSIFSEAQAAEMESFDLPGDGVEELWRMAEQVEHSGSASDYEGAHDAPPASRQSAEEALEALRMLASKGSPKYADDEPAKPQTQASLSDDDELVFSDIEDLPPIGADLMAELEGGFSLLDDNNEVEPRKLETTEARRGNRTRDEEPPSLLERLMEEPGTDWGKPSADKRLSASTPDPLEDLPDSLADFDEFPEPEFAFHDDPIEAKDQTAIDRPEPADMEAMESEESEAVGDIDLTDLEAALAGDYDDAEIDPLAELIKAEEAAKAAAELDDDLDEAVADQLVNELAEEAFRDDLDLQELERSLKVVPFPTPDREPAKNGHHSHADEIVAKAAEDLDASSDSPGGAIEEVESRTKAPARRAPSNRPGRQPTKFKPSMIMAGIEPSLQGYLQGDPLESWRGKAVESAWGKRGGPVAHSFEASTGNHLASLGNRLEALRPERRYRAKTGVSVTVCTPAQAQDIEPPKTDWKPRRPDSAQQSPQSLSAAPQAWIRLGPEYKACEDPVLVGIRTHDGDEKFETPRAIEEFAASLQAPLAPGGLFFDSVSAEERFVDEEDWDDSAVSLGDPSEGIDLSDDFANEQPATQSSGGRRGR